jgi:uncharacterized protein YkwD
MRTHRFVRRLAAVTIMVASAALPAGVAHSADTSGASLPSTKVAGLADMVDASSRSVDDDQGLPTKPITLLRVRTTPTVTPLTPDPVAPAPPAVQTPATQTPQPPAVKTTSPKVATTPKTTTKKTTAAAPPAAPAVAPAATSGSVTARQDLAGAVASATNAQRTAAGLKPLAYRACSVPAAWAVSMASAGSLTHNSMMTVLSACGGKTTAGENIAAGYTSVSAVTAGWMGSAGHKANILNPNFTIISVGVAQAANGTYYWVEDFTG